MIGIKNLNKYYSKGRENEIHVINDMTFELPDKGMVALFGKSGCGKTTLLNVIGGLDRFGSGSVEIDGHSIKNDTDDLRNRYIGYIFQNYNLDKAVSAAENVGNALRLCGVTDEEEIKRRTAAALSCVGLENFSGRTPDTLSGGQQQRVAIARAIVKGPRIILADEPTGNLDEENTVMIMDLLRKIADDHLVVLVTHEENLVDYYCDTVVQLSDGRIESIRENGPSSGYVSKSKNDIWLGELENTRGTAAGADISYYGKLPDEPVGIRIINNGGSFYLKIDTPKVRVIDESSEIRLREGVFEPEKKTTGGKEIDMSTLTPVNCGKTGRLFGVKSSLISGFRTNFTGNRAGKKTLLAVLAVFSIVMVFLVATFGTAIKQISDIESSYNHNVTYLNIPDFATYGKLKALAEDPASGIDSIGIKYGFPRGNETLSFSLGNFESFTAGYFAEDYEASGVFLPISLASGAKTAAGKSSDLKKDEIVITTAVASRMLENAPYSFISTVSDLIGLQSSDRYGDVTLRIAGIVESDETAFYMDEAALADRILAGYSGPLVQKASDFGIAEPGDGEVIIVSDALSESEYSDMLFSKGDEIVISGKKYTVSEIYTRDDIYGFLSDDEERKVWLKSVPCGLVSDSEFVRIAFSAEDTDERLSALQRYEMYDEGTVVLRYAVVHSNSPADTEKLISGIVPSGVSPDYAVIYPSDIRAGLISDGISGIVSHIVAMVVFTVILCLCMYFIMRSAMMSRVREIGIYRAIGVKNGNIIFRFLIESAVLTTLTVFAAFLVSSLIAGNLASMNSMKNVMYYPVWLAALLAVFMYGVCLLCGIAPVASLLRRTPSEILSKYDI